MTINPCHFCGNLCHYRGRPAPGRTRDAGEWHWQVQCAHCGYCGPECADQEEAIRKHNEMSRKCEAI